MKAIVFKVSFLLLRQHCYNFDHEVIVRISATAQLELGITNLELAMRSFVKAHPKILRVLIKLFKIYSCPLQDVALFLFFENY
jgi:hypothetical protein